MSSPGLPLDGIRVVDFGWVWAGAVPGHLLADLGAEVIKVETRKRLDYMRQGRPIVGDKPDPEQNAMFHNVNRNKLGITVDLTHPEGARLLRDLVSRSDVVIENFVPGVLTRHGLDYPALSAVRPDLIMISMSAAGQTGELRDLRSYATVIAGLSGLDSMVGYPGERVLGMQVPYADPNASLHAAFALLAAIWHRQATGEGQYIDLSQWEAGMAVTGEALLAYALTGEVPGPAGNHDPRLCPHGAYPCRGEDRWITIAVGTDAEWEALRHCLGDPAWAADPELKTLEGRLPRRDEIDRSLAEWTRERDAFELRDRLQAVGVAAAPVMTAEDLYLDPHYRERGTFVEIDHPILGSEVIYNTPFRLSGTPPAVRRRAPFLGEHNGYVFGELLGLSPDVIRRLEAEQVIG